MTAYKHMPILWHVTATWANKGNEGEIDKLVLAENAIEALQLAWESEDPMELREVSIKWMSPLECITVSEALTLDEWKIYTPIVE
jgi:hypothetical protein